MSVYNSTNKKLKEQEEKIKLIQWQIKYNQRYQNALDLFDSIKNNDNNINMNAYCYSMALHSCGNLLSLYQGEMIINEIKQIQNADDIFNNLDIQSAMICMYAKCSQFDKAIDIFNKINIKKLMDNDNQDILRLFASIIDCYAKMGNVEDQIASHPPGVTARVNRK